MSKITPAFPVVKGTFKGPASKLLCTVYEREGMKCVVAAETESQLQTAWGQLTGRQFDESLVTEVIFSPAENFKAGKP